MNNIINGLLFGAVHIFRIVVIFIIFCAFLETFRDMCITWYFRKLYGDFRYLSSTKIQSRFYTSQLLRNIHDAIQYRVHKLRRKNPRHFILKMTYEVVFNIIKFGTIYPYLIKVSNLDPNSYEFFKVKRKINQYNIEISFLLTGNNFKVIWSTKYNNGIIEYYTLLNMEKNKLKTQIYKESIYNTCDLFNIVTPNLDNLAIISSIYQTTKNCIYDLNNALIDIEFTSRNGIKDIIDLIISSLNLKNKNMIFILNSFIYLINTNSNFYFKLGGAIIEYDDEEGKLNKYNIYPFICNISYSKKSKEEDVISFKEVDHEYLNPILLFINTLNSKNILFELNQIKEFIKTFYLL